MRSSNSKPNAQMNSGRFLKVLMNKINKDQKAPKQKVRSSSKKNAPAPVMY